MIPTIITITYIVTVTTLLTVFAIIADIFGWCDTIREIEGSRNDGGITWAVDI